MSGELDHVRVVLCGSQHAGNLGAVARAMRCMGLDRLALVAPQADHLGDEARRRASRADAVLEAARVVDDLRAAVGDCHLVLGASGRTRGVETRIVDVRAAAELTAARPEDQVAFVFGAERAGLTNEELESCHLRVLIPTAPDYRSLNLAAAVQVTAWELRMAHLGAGATGARGPFAEPPATAAELDRFFVHLWEALEAIRFLRPELPTYRRVKERLQRMYTRLAPDQAELRLLRGVQTRTLEAAAAARERRGDRDE